MPEILASDLKDQSVYESTPVSFEVIAQGIPKLEAQWTLNGKPLTPNDHYNISEDGLRYKLSIADVKLADAGTFKVIVKNKLGEQSKQCELSVMRKYKKNRVEIYILRPMFVVTFKFIYVNRCQLLFSCCGIS